MRATLVLAVALGTASTSPSVAQAAAPAHGSGPKPPSVSPSSVSPSSVSPSSVNPPAVVPPPVVPPQLVEAPPVPYPEGASGDATVLLEITVDKSGAVTGAKAIAGTEPFASAAVAVAPRFTFRPATRGDVPVAARIRLELAFHEPKRIEPAPEPETAAAAAPEEVEEVHVAGDKRPGDGRIVLSNTEIRQLPGAFGDPFRAIDILPSVTPILSGLPYYYFRGAPPSSTGYLLDGIRVPYLYHLAIGPAIVHPSLVDGVDLYTGVAPIEYGRYAGGILAGHTKAPGTRTRAELSLRAVDAGALVEAPLFGGRGSVLAAGRYSYTAFMISRFTDKVELDYRDAQLRLTYDLTPRDRLTAFGFGSFDQLRDRDDPKKAFRTRFGVEFYRARLEHEHTFDGGATLRTGVTAGWDRSFLATGRVARMFGVSADSVVDAPLASNLRVRAGLQANVDSYSTSFSATLDPLEPNARDLVATFGARTDTVVGAFVSLPWEASRVVSVVPSVRADLYSTFGVTDFSVDPRVQTRVALSRSVRVLQGFGLATQLPAYPLPIPALQPGGIPGGFQKSVQSQAGVEVDLPAGFSTRVMGFHHAYAAMNDAFPAADQIDLSLDPAQFRTNRVPGQAYGLELLVRRNVTERLSGMLSYTLSRSERTLPEGRAAAGFDRTHVLNVALGYDLGAGWHVGARLVTYTGAPRNPVALEPGESTPETPRFFCPSRRLPPFVRLDARVEKMWKLGRDSSISLVLEGLNVTGTAEVTGQWNGGVYNGVSTGPCDDQAVGPIAIPNFSLEARF